MKIKTAEQLRNHILKKIEQLDDDEIEIEELANVSKAGEVIYSGIKLELAYNNMRNETPNIDFLQSCNKGKPLTSSIGINSEDSRLVVF